MVEEKRGDVSKHPQFDISNEAYRTYWYPDGTSFTVKGAVTLILEKRDGLGADRHRLIIRKDAETEGPAGAVKVEEGMYVVPGWRAISWSGKDGKHGITF